MNKKLNNNETNKSKIENNKKDFLKAIVVTICILCVVQISVTIAFSIYWKDNISFDTVAESSLLSTGLSIIGIAVAVWAGLNIANSIDRKKIDELSNRTKNLPETLEKLEESLELICDNYKKIFLEELLKNGKDMATMYFYDFLNKHIDESKYPLDIYIEIVKIEQTFGEVLKLHSSQYEYNFALISKATNGQDLIDTLLERYTILDKKMQSYLEFRKSDFYFYKGYCSKSTSEIFSNYYNAIKGYYKFGSNFGVTENLFNSKLIIPNYTYNQNVEMARYVSNSIGESYSKIIHLCRNDGDFVTIDCEIDFVSYSLLVDYSEKAVFYTQCAVLWNNTIRYEVYFRNAACALERRDILQKKIFENKQRILDLFKNAFYCCVNNKNVPVSNIKNTYYATLSYYKRTIENYLIKNLKIDIEIIDVNTIISSDLNIDRQEINNFIDFYYISKIGVKQNPLMSLCWVMLGFSLSFIAILNFLNSCEIRECISFEKSNNELISEVKNCLDFLGVMGINDLYYAQLQKYHNFLESLNNNDFGEEK